MQPKMVVALMGGLGNQLFQYAFGISVAETRNQDVGFTTHRLSNDKWRPAGYQLDKFVDDIKLGPSSWEEAPYIQDDLFTFQPSIYKAGIDSNVRDTFIGFWQTEKYFNEKLVREKVRFRHPLSDQSLRVAEQISKAGKASAFLHVRRGADYKRSDYHGLISTNYYDGAIKHIRERYSNVNFFVFGDDPNWIRERFVGQAFVIVDHIKPDTDAIHEDIHLMSLCQNGVIANSSFSWWGAWLSEGNPGDHTIIAPKNWFNKAPLDASDVVPARWTKIDN